MAASVPTLVAAGVVKTDSSGTPQWGAAPTVGNLLVAIIAAGTTPLAVVTGTGWVEATGARAVASAASKTQIFYKLAADSSDNANPPTFTNTVFSQLLEFKMTGEPSFTFALDQTGNAVDQASGGNVTAAGADKYPAGNDLIVTADFWRIVAALDTTSDSYNNGATATATSADNNNDSTSINNHYRFSYGVTTGNGAANKNTITCSSTPPTHSAHSIASFRPIVKLGPTAVASGESVGTNDSLLRILSSSAIGTTETFGSARIVRLIGNAGAISSSEAFGPGTQVVLIPAGPSGFGAASLSDLEVYAVTVADLEAYGISITDLERYTVTVGDLEAAGITVTEALLTDISIDDFPGG